MDAPDVIDDVNALLKLGVCDSYRLEHIKQSYIQNKTIWITDKNYLEQMKEKYLTKQIDEPLEPEQMIHCWKCGKKSQIDANFCKSCGAALFEVGEESDIVEKPIVTHRKKRWKIPVLIGIPVLILISLGVGYVMSFDSIPVEPVVDSEVEPVILTPDQQNSKCGPGTIFDVDSNSCVLG